MIDKIKEICEKVGVKPIVILKTSRVGEEVDNGMGVEFELAEWALIFKRVVEGAKARDIVFRFEYGEDEVKIQKFDIDRLTSLEEMISELKETDAYEVVWRDNEYKKPENIQSTLIRRGVAFEVKTVKYYSVKVSYDEIKKYVANFTDAMDYDELLLKILRDQPDLEKIAHNSGYLRDRMLRSHDFVRLTNEGIIFNFGYEGNEKASFERRKERWNTIKMTEAEEDEITRKFENENVIKKAIDYIEQLYSFDKKNEKL